MVKYLLKSSQSGMGREGTTQFFDFGPFRLDAIERVLLADGHPVALTPKAFETLLALLERNNHVLEKADLLKQIWPDTFVEEGVLVQNICTLRKVLKENGDGSSYIETVPRRGYRFGGQVRQSGTDDSVPFITAPVVPAVQQAQRNPNKLMFTALCLGALAVLPLLAFLPREPVEPRSRTVPQRTMLAVLPFENLSGDSQQDYLSAGLTEEMITQLAILEPSRLGVIAPNLRLAIQGHQEKRAKSRPGIAGRLSPGRQRAAGRRTCPYYRPIDSSKGPDTCLGQGLRSRPPRHFVAAN